MQQLWRLDQSVRDVTAQRQREAIRRLTQWSLEQQHWGGPPPGEVLVRCVGMCAGVGPPPGEVLVRCVIMCGQWGLLQGRSW